MGSTDDLSAKAGALERENDNRGDSLRKEPEMAYKKPQIVAKSAAKQSFVAGCPTDKAQSGCHNSHNRACEIAQKL